jgi:hypothetical protein
MATITFKHEEIADRIIATEGMIFAIAVHGGTAPQIGEARQFLKVAIAQALADAEQEGYEDAELTWRNE